MDRMLAAAASLALGATLSLTALVPAVAVPRPMCLGKPATIVGQPGKALTGTQHADVIVSDGAASVSSKGGNDLICLTHTLRGTPRRQVVAGPGDDRIDASNVGGDSLEVYLGAGDDAFIGGPERDTVHARGGGSDRVYSGPGNDAVYAGGVPVEGIISADHDVVHLGLGDDVLRPSYDGSSQWYGEGGHDYLGLPDVARSASSFDAVTGTAELGGKTVLRWSGVEQYQLPARGADVSFVGSDADEELDLWNPSATGTLSVSMGGGDDLVDLRHQSYVKTAVALDGGTGHDLLVSDSQQTETGNDTLDVDVARHVIGVKGGKQQQFVSGSIAGFEDVTGRNYDGATFQGDAEANHFDDLELCGLITMNGAGGDDLLTIDTDGDPRLAVSHARTCPVDMHGGPGNDTMVGSYGDDDLVGDAGTDSADGSGEGHDVCDAETVTGCNP